MFTFLILSLAIVVMYIFWVLFKPRKKTSGNRTAGKKISKKNHPALKETRQQAALSSTDQTRKKRNEQMKRDPELISRVIRYWLKER